MSVILGARDTITLLRDINVALHGEVPVARRLAQETTLLSMDSSLASMDASLTSIDSKTPALGPALAAASVPVVLASDSMVTTSPDRTLIDAFGRQRVSNIVTIFDSKQTSDNQALYWNTVTTGTGAATYVAANACTVLSTAAPGDSVIRQTYRRFNYQPGKSQLIFMTGILRNPGVFNVGITSRIGHHDANNGVFFQFDNAAGTQVGIRKGGVDTLVPQASWNLDTFNGTGPSGLFFDSSATQIFVMNYEWLGVGSVWFGLVVNGLLYWVHRADHANVAAAVYMQTPNNPLRYEIAQTAPGDGAMTAICSSINSEGGNDPNGKVLSIGRTTIAQANVADTNPEKVLLALRYRDVTAAQVDIDILSVSVLSTGSGGEDNIAIVRLIRDASTQLRNLTNTGPPVLTWSPIANSALEVARPPDGPNEAFVVTDNMLGTSGTVIVAQYSTGNEAVPSGPVRNAIRMGMSVAGVSDIIVLSMYGAITWREL
jgi:hypothetical protein